MDTIPAKELDWYVEKPGYLMIDLRSNLEYDRMHIRGAINVPDGEFGSLLDGHRGCVLILYCDRGSRSMTVARSLEQQGWQTKTVVGGIHAYRGGNMERWPGESSH
ncbi:MAG: rhodanese-like domain-containing protein [Lachnospiraceae bacterium]|nr:rhodanese-like domain-containing protein [Lachnospiraceae bacterium]